VQITKQSYTWVYVAVLAQHCAKYLDALPRATCCNYNNCNSPEAGWRDVTNASLTYDRLPFVQPDALIQGARG
jgi:hypothetical protein